jgi:predicted metal-dependent peptidase
MALQYLSDNEGNHTAVLVPIEEWEQITSKLRELEHTEKQVQTDRKKKPSDFFGTIPKDVAQQMQEYVKQSRDEWEIRLKKNGLSA